MRNIRFNVSGEIFYIPLDILRKHPTTTLGNAQSLIKFYDPARDEYFLDRHRPTFWLIYDYYMTGVLERSEEVPLRVIVDELKFYSLEADVINDFLMSECILAKEPMSNIQTRTKFKRILSELICLQKHDESDSFSRSWEKYRQRFIRYFNILIVVSATIGFIVDSGFSPEYGEKSESTDRNLKRLEFLFGIWFSIQLFGEFVITQKFGTFDKLIFLINIISLQASIQYLVINTWFESSEKKVFLRVINFLRGWRVLLLERFCRNLRHLLISIYETKFMIGQVIIIILFTSVIIGTFVYSFGT